MLPFDIELADVKIPVACPVFGIVLDTDVPRGHGKQSDSAPSLDRVIPALGYVRGNIQVISWRANRLKHVLTANEARQLAQYMEEYAPDTLY